ncbi:MAG: hypothetical protein QF858_01920, partial [Candidatus Pacebacteria bacterium]|nr:hypothetical protein [Candidatus Paceibacterota bacterium]
MTIVGSKSFKVNRVENSSEAQAEQRAQEEVRQLSAELDDQFGLFSDAENTPVYSEEPLDDFLLGDNRRVSSTGDAVETKLTDYPPALDELLLGHEHAPNYIDIIISKYKNTAEELNEMRQLAKDALLTGKVSTHEASALQRRIELIDKALLRTENEMARA